MFDLLSLPNEILHRIIESVNPKDLDHFSESCLSLEYLFEKSLAAHHKREREYTKIFLHGCYCLGDDNHPLDLLSAICRDSHVALYPVSLTIDCHKCEKEKHTDLRNTTSAVTDTMTDYANKIQNLVMNCGYINMKNKEL